MRKTLFATIVVILELPGAVLNGNQQPEQPPTDRSVQAGEPSSASVSTVPSIRLEDLRSALASDLSAMAEALTRIEAKVDGPTFFERLRDDFISNTIWTLVTSSDSDGARIRWAASVMGLALVVLKVLFFFLSRRAVAATSAPAKIRPAGIKRAGVGEAVVNGALWLYVAVVSVLATILAVSGGVPTKVAPTTNLRTIEERLDRLGASVDEMARSAGQGAAQGQVPSQSWESVLDNRVAPLRSELQTVAASVSRTEQQLTQVNEDAATTGHQWFNTLLLLALGGGVVWILVRTYS